MKKVIGFLLAAVMVLSMSGIAVLADDAGYDAEKIYVTYNDVAIEFDVEPVLMYDRTLVPIRAVANAFGVSDDDISYDDATRDIEIKYQGKVIKMTVDSQDATVDGVATKIDVPATEIDGRTLVPLRFISESFDKTVNWFGFGNGADGGFVVITD